MDILKIVAKMLGKSVIHKHLFAEHFVKSCLEFQESYKNNFVKQFTSLHISLLATWTKALLSKMKNKNQHLL